MDYITVYVTDTSRAYSGADNNELEVLCGITEHGEGKWTYWSDTGNEFEEIRQPKFKVVETLDHVGEIVTALSEKQMDVAYEKFMEQYWENFVEGNYSF